MTENLFPKLMQGKKGIITGVANNMSIAWHIAKELHNNGAELAFTYQSEILEKRIVPLAAELGCDKLYKCDVADEESLKDMFVKIGKDLGKIDFIVHSIAFADKSELQNRYVDTTRHNFLNSMLISCFSLTEITRYALPLLNTGSSIITLSYLGADKVVPGYNVMGLSKAALESSVKYLAHDLGADGIRVNAISAGPIRTLASSGISEIKTMINYHQNTAPLKRNVTQTDVAKSALYLLSDLSSGVTGEIHYVDGGYNVMGMVSN